MVTNKLTDLPRSAMEAYDALSLPVWLFSVDTLRILASNAAAQTWLGYDAQTLQSLTIADVGPEEDRIRLIEHVGQFDGAVSDVKIGTIITRSGERFTVSFSWSKVLFDGTEAIVAIIRYMIPTAKAQGNAAAQSIEFEALQQKAQVSKEDMSRLLRALPGKILVLTPDEYTLVAVTDEFARAVSVDRAAVLGKPLFDVLPLDPNEPQNDIMSELQASLQRVQTLHLTDVMSVQRYPVRQKDGTLQDRFWLAQNKPVFDQEDRLIYIIHRVEDVTEVLAETSAGDGRSDVERAASERLLPTVAARVALRALQEREARLTIAEKLLDIGSWEVDLERETMRWSSQMYEMNRVPHDQEAPSFPNYFTMVHPEDRAQAIATLENFIETKTPEIIFQHRIIRPDSTLMHIRGVGARHRVDGREVLLGFAQDITRFKEAEEQLVDAARLRRTAGYLARLGSWRVDLGHERVIWGQGTAAIHDEPAGKQPTLDEAMDYYVPEHRERMRAEFNACLQGGQSFDEILQIITAKGRRVWVRALGQPVHNAEGRIIAVEGAFQDISDLVAARNESEALSRRLRQTLENISDAFFLLDQDWRFSFLNSRTEVLLRRSRDDLLGKVVWEEFPESVGSTFQTEYERAISEGQAVRFQEYFSLYETWFEVNAYPTPEGLAVYFRDVTQQRARDKQLRLLENAVSRQNDILLITEAEPIDGPDGPKIVYVNDAFERRTGFLREEAVGQTPRILQGPKTQREVLDRIRSAMKKWQPVSAELINYTKSGEEFWLDLDIVPLADESGSFTHWVAIERDISERKQSEAALRTNEERFRLIAKSTGNALWEWNAATRLHWWSEGFFEIFGHEPGLDEATPTPGIWSQHIHPDDREHLEKSLNRLLSGQSDIFNEHYKFRRADGTWAQVEDRAFAIHDEDGTVIRVLGSMTDITERLQLEEKLRQAKKMVAVGQLTGGVAHDFNNLLTIILGNAEMLSDKLSDQPHLQALADAIADAADRGAELTSQLLAFSRKQPLAPTVIDVSSLICGLEGMLRRTLPENINIEVIRAGGLWKTEVDAAQLEAALLNLALNARDAMPEGGSLTIETANAALDDDYVTNEWDVEAGQYVLIVVTDTGHGIPADILGQVFEPFFTTKDVGKGSGLGLSMVYGFIKQTGGHIRVYSEPGEGTSFRLYLPRSHAKGAQIQVDYRGRKMIGGNETILVVEDDRLVRENVIAQLKELGYRVLSAPAGADALEILNQSHEIDLLFTDVVMPGGMGGRALADAARAVFPGLKVLFTSGYTENSMVHNGRLDLGIDLLSKPYRRDQLAVKVRKVLDDG